MDLITLDSVLGKITFSIQSDRPIRMTCTSAAVTRLLPAGMSVMTCRAVLLHFDCAEPLTSPRIRMQCDTKVAGSPTTGEWLEAQEWESNEHILVVGTEDAGALAPRMPFLKLGEFDEIVEYGNDFMEIRLGRVPPRRQVSLHFVIAENPIPEPAPESAWYAVGMLHRELLPLMVDAPAVDN